MTSLKKISVGILTEKEIEFEFFGNFFYDNNLIFSGIQKVVFQKEKIFFENNFYKEINFTPENDNCFFELKNVTIGKEFHWKQKENQRFMGSLKFIVEDEKITAVNIISAEDYLKSVISSEMNASSSLELLKAHAVISRSWLLANEKLRIKNEKSNRCVCSSGNSSFIKWYERDAHRNFDVCADDHCQRYQGILRQSNERVNQAVMQTCGVVLMYDGEICDTRFSKSCGGKTELFKNCWADMHLPYLESVVDAPQENGVGERADLTNEKNAEKWILSSPECFCNTHDANILAQVLNNYDRATTDFFRWEKEFSQKEISETICKKSGFDFGEILDLIPMRRGESGRIVELQIVGTKQIMTVGKELEIRKWLSETHLYSSAFVVEKFDFKENIPQKFVLRGAGWGHGVGLCQIGAAVMGERGYKFDEILMHYFKNTELKKIY
ncbi:MAG: SpoIID/LytB domain-containing protein [Paludibacter sp.]|nr:SpoIID/LytB domain-containing protein [Paludibacter sp.]